MDRLNSLDLTLSEKEQVKNFAACGKINLKVLDYFTNDKSLTDTIRRFLAKNKYDCSVKTTDVPCVDRNTISMCPMDRLNALDLTPSEKEQITLLAARGMLNLKVLGYFSDDESLIGVIRRFLARTSQSEMSQDVVTTAEYVLDSVPIVDVQSRTESSISWLPGLRKRTKSVIATPI